MTSHMKGEEGELFCDTMYKSVSITVILGKEGRVVASEYGRIGVTSILNDS